MIIAIMQPYFFPYIGYFQLMHAVDVFVFYDDVQFIKNGWINRNRILVGDRPSWLTLPVKRDGHHTDRINQRRYALDEGVESVRAKLRSSYSHACGFEETYTFVDSVLHFPSANVALFNVNLLRCTARSLGLDCRFATSSEVAGSEGLHGEARVIKLCRTLGAHQYINAIGGLGLYDPQHFAEAGLGLSFLRTSVPPQPLRDGPAHLSILDGMFRESPARIVDKLDRYELIPG